MEIVVWAAAEAERLSGGGMRWRHLRGAAERAREIAAAVPSADRETLVAAAYLHDIGYSRELAVLGFHPIDGARWLHRQGLDRLAGLVAHHSGAAVEARARGLEALIAEFQDERSPVSDAVTYCDLMTGPGGELVDVAQRLAEIEERHGSSSLVAGAIRLASAGLLGEVARVEQRLAAGDVAA